MTAAPPAPDGGTTAPGARKFRLNRQSRPTWGGMPARRSEGAIRPAAVSVARVAEVARPEAGAPGACGRPAPGLPAPGAETRQLRAHVADDGLQVGIRAFPEIH